jgi:hypothetical protein
LFRVLLPSLDCIIPFQLKSGESWEWK